MIFYFQDYVISYNMYNLIYAHGYQCYFIIKLQNHDNNSDDFWYYNKSL